ncbi:MAG TPA: alpha/beta fold hydrolase [Methylomirabilota bacterium]|nr:alpha/beta fold hydrolase [Methylomirabilota bacterium]
MNAPLSLVCAFFSVLACAAVPDAAAPNRDSVVLLHGMGRTTVSMQRLDWSLKSRGYQVINLSLPSTRLSVERLAGEHLAPAVQRIGTRPEGRIHFVTHSLGGIVLRQYLAENSLPNLGRVVMLGPPNQGSEVADRLKNNVFYQFATGPGGQQLGTRAGDLPCRLGPVSCELGVIAGDRSFNPFFSRLLNGPDDGKVSVASTRLKGMSDFLVLRTSHTWMTWRQPVIDQVLAFLASGRFHRPEITSLE